MYSITDLSGSPGQTNFTIPFPYLDRSHIFVFIDSAATVAFSFNSATIIALTTPLVGAATVRIARVTPIDNPITVLHNGSVLGESDVNPGFLQSLYRAQEMEDWRNSIVIIDDTDGQLNAHSKVIKNVANPSNSNDAANKTYVDGVVIAGSLANISFSGATMPNCTLPDPTITLKATGQSVTRNIKDILGDFVSVKGFGALGNTVGNDNAAIALAIAYCILNNIDTLYWPFGAYLTTANIANFHSVRHRGAGVILRNGGSFAIEALSGTTNNLYMSTTGLDTNDGLGTGQPFLTLQAAGNVIYKFAYTDATWKINAAAGNYAAANVSFNRAFPSSQRVQFLGPTVARGVQPTAIFNAASPGTGTDVVALYLQSGIRAQISNINFKGARTAASVNANNDSAGVVMDGRCELYSDNVWTDDCDNGIYMTNGSQARIQAGRHGFNAIDACGVKFIRHCQGTVGYGGSAADVTGATGTAFIGGSYGVSIQEFSMAHTDNCYYSTQTQAGVICSTGRVHSVTSTYLNCLVGIDCRLNADLGNTSNTFTGCTQNLALRSGSRNAGVQYAESLLLGPAASDTDGLGGSTSSVTPVTIYTRAFEAGEFQQRGTGFKLNLYCKVTGVAGTKTIVITLGATTLLTATIAASTTNYEIQVDFMITTSTNNERCFTRILQNGVLSVLAGTTPTEDLTLAKTLTVTHQVTNAADSNTVLFTELQMRH